MADASKSLFDFKKQIEVLKKFRGRGTELVSVYITPGYPLSDIAGKLRDEYGQAANIKSKTTQKNVQSALERILNHLKIFKKTPENGIAIFAGNISEVEGRTDVQLFTIEPPMPLNTQFYRCESVFVTEPLEELADSTDTYGLVVMDGKEATVALLQGKKIKIIKQLNSTAHQKVSKGGQCLKFDSLVCLNDGRIMEIKYLEEGAKISSANFKSYKTIHAKVQDKFEAKSTTSVTISTKNPILKITSTPEHRFFVLGSDGIEEKKAAELQKGTMLLFTGKLPQPSEYSDDISDLSNLVEKKYEVKENGRKFLKSLRQNTKSTQKEAGKQVGNCQMSMSDLETGEYKNVERLDELLKYCGICPKEFYCKHAEAVPQLHLPKKWTPQLAQFLGYLTGDGAVDGNRIKLYDGDQENLIAYGKIVKELFNIDAIMKTRMRKYRFSNYPKGEAIRHFTIPRELKIYNKNLADIVNKEFPEIRLTSDKKEIPQRLLSTSPTVLSGFVRGIFDAEATVSSGQVTFVVTSEKLVGQLQLVLLRYGIICSIFQRKAHFKKQYALNISNRDSLEKFQKLIGFTSPDKTRKLGQILSKKSNIDHKNKTPIAGKLIAKIAKEMGCKIGNFKKHTPAIYGNTKMSMRTYTQGILPPIRKKVDELKREKSPKYEKAAADLTLLENIGNGDLRIAQINTISHQSTENEVFYDLNIPQYENYVANGFIVHNSAARYSRLHTEAVEFYYTRIGEAMNAFVGVKNFKGVIVGGPGPAKHDFVKQAPQNYQLKILGVVDTGYTDEYGIRETLEKSDEIIAGQEAVVEKKLMDQFMREVSTGGLAAYGLTDIQAKLANRQIDKLLVTEGLELKKFDVVCGACGKTKTVYGETYTPQECSCFGKYEDKNEEDIMESLLAEAEKQNVTVVFISKDTAEGAQFYATFKGLGAFLRYK